MNLIKVDGINIRNETYKNKTGCYELENVVLDLREFGKHQEWEQSLNIKVYSNNKRVKKYINRNPENNALWYNEPAPTMDYDIQSIDQKDIPIDVEIDEMFFLYDYLEWQYSHFLTDVFPKMWYFNLLKKSNVNLKIGQIRPIVNFAPNMNDLTLNTKLNIVSDFAHDLTDFYLDHIGASDKFIPLESGKAYFIKRFVIPIPFTSQDTCDWPDVQYKMYELLKKGSKKVKTKFPKNVMISRYDIMKNGWFNFRHCVNEEEIFEAVKPLGFEKLELMPLSVFEKIKVYGNADNIIQQVGSNCFNVVFCNPGTKLFTLTNYPYTAWIPMLTNLSNRNFTEFVPVTEGIEILPGIEGGPDYKKDEKPWKLNDIKGLVRLIQS